MFSRVLVVQGAAVRCDFSRGGNLEGLIRSGWRFGFGFCGRSANWWFELMLGIGSK